jgi:hypothetical protein
MKYVFDAVELQSMPSIRTALKAGDDIIVFGQYVDDFSLSLVAPLQA